MAALVVVGFFVNRARDMVTRLRVAVSPSSSPDPGEDSLVALVTWSLGSVLQSALPLARSRRKRVGWCRRYWL